MKGLDPDLAALQEVRDQVARARAAQAAVAGHSQEQIDRLCRAMARAGASAAHDLARLAVEETGIGRVHYKVLKNLFGSEGVWASIEKEPTVGIVSRDEAAGVMEVATPVGVVAGIIPTTNPTSTALYKGLIAVKGRNSIVISPHPRARRCIGEAVEVLRRAIEREGGPADLVCCLSNPTIESTGALMRHRDVAVILSTGGSGLVQAAYSSGKPAYGVGPGNVPAYVDRSADLGRAAADLVSSQSFDNGSLCCSEQGLVLDRPIAEAMLAELRARGAHLCDPGETASLGRLCNRGGHMNPEVVGLDPCRVAEMAGFTVPTHTSVLLAEQGGVGPEHPLSIEILCPLLSVHRVDGWEEGCRVCKEILHHGGLGHTLVIHAADERVLEAFFLEKPANRIVANGPSSQGAVGFSTNLVPAMSLGCGPQAGNITSDNITARHLLNFKRVAFPRRDWPELERRFHQRAADLCGDPAPRGSGLPGDPARVGRPAGASHAGGPAREPLAGSNWGGNPAFVPDGDTGLTPATVIPRPAAPTFTRPRVTSAPGRRPTPPAPNPGTPSPPTAPPPTAPPRAAPPPIASRRTALPPTPPTGAGPDVGAALSVAEIQNIMDRAGEGCPLGPCAGCPHHQMTTGACTA